MKKFLLIIPALIGVSLFGYSRHITGGEIFHTYLGPGSSPGTSQYLITLRLFRDFFSTGAELDPSVNIAIYDKLTNNEVSGSPFAVELDHIDILEKSGNIPCIVNAPDVKFKVGYYFFTVTLQNNSQGYWVVFQRCCRIDNITNLSVAVGTGATYLGSIAGTSTLGSGNNSSPEFLVKDTALVCQNRNFTLDFGATDPDGDLLTYEFCEAYDGGSNGSPVVTNPPPPPYNSVPYQFGYSATAPLGPGIGINANTGLISGVAPSAGTYVIAVCITEWRNGVPINTHRKDFILKVADCDFVAAQLPLSAVYCENFNVYFENMAASSLIYSWFWDFGVVPIQSDTSNLPTPTYTYPDTGTFTVKLVVNRGDPCSDSTTMQLGVYPGCFPDFISTGVCVNKPTQFVDQSNTTYGSVNSWRWDFGESSASNDTSRVQNPSYTYNTTGVKTVQLVITSTKGCRDTITHDITIIDKPPLSLPFRDTLICSIDTLQLNAIGNGTWSWTPGYNISNATTSSPLVWPKQTTYYVANLDDNGCKNKDSIRVRVVDFVTLQVRPDTTFCRGDGVQLNAVTDALAFSWTPASDLSDPNIVNPIANPFNTTTYQLTASIGKCSASDAVTVKVVPYPIVNAGPDTTVCFRTAAQLNGSVVASNFYWKPQGTLNNPNILNPIAVPSGTTHYVLTGTDTLGCPKPSFDTAIVTVLPKVNAFAGNDTAIVVGQPLQLNASGGEGYFWSPPTGLTSTSVFNPMAFLNGSIDSIRYVVHVTDEKGCVDSADIIVKVFKTNPQIFVPTGFTPNGDGLNETVKPIAVGIDKIEYFRVYNRWGQLVFSTTINGHGWDGRIGGRLQATNTYVWLVKARDYTGKQVFQKGTVTLIR